MSEQRQTKHKGWTITITAMSHGFDITAGKEGETPLPSVDAESGNLKKRIQQMKNKVDETIEALAKNVNELRELDLSE